MRVVKLGGRVQQSAALHAAIASAWRTEPGVLCVVHGGGDEISTLQRAFGLEPRFVGGRRATSEAEIDLVRMALSGSANKRLVAALRRAGAPAVGLSGEDGGLLVARQAAGGTLGRVGEPVAVHVQLLEALFAAGMLPVLSPLASDVDGGGALNVNGDDAAAALVAAGTAAGGMAAKLEAARRALEAGVPCVRIGGVAALSDPSSGTAVTPARSLV